MINIFGVIACVLVAVLAHMSWDIITDEDINRLLEAKRLAIEECERELPRTYHCEIEITAKPVLTKER